MNTGLYKSVILCEYILHPINCLLWAISLSQCTFPPIFARPTSCNRYTHTGLEGDNEGEYELPLEFGDSKSYPDPESGFHVNSEIPGTEYILNPDAYLI
jgi:hypothetical protein